MESGHNCQVKENTPTGDLSSTSSEYHPVALLFPMMSEETFKELRTDIETHGQLSPIWIHEGQIIDGRNRYRACLDLGIKPQFREWDGRGSLVNFVLSLNLKRRHLTTTQRAMVAFHMLPLLEAEAKERQIRKAAGSVPEILPEQRMDSRDQAAALVGVSGRYVSDIKRIAQDAPEKMVALEAGTLTLQGAKRQIAGKIAKPPGNCDPVQVEPEAMSYASEAIAQLSRIKDDDPQVLAAMERIRAYIGHRIQCLLNRSTRPLSDAAAYEAQMILFEEAE
jgi:hypothetical protein